MATITLGSGDQIHAYVRTGGPIDDTITDFGSIYFTTTINGANEVPPNASTATGAGTLALNKAQTRLTMSYTTSGLDFDGTQTPGVASDNVVSMHIHRAPVGVNGAIKFGMIGPNNDLNGDLVINAAAGTVVSAWDANEGQATTLATEVPFLLANGLYVNIHSAALVAGEIRGQVIKQDNGADRIDLSGANIGEFATLLQVATEVAGDTVIETLLNGVSYKLTLDGVGLANLSATDFTFAGTVNETINGTGAADDLFGAGGNDALNGGLGTDRLFGESGGDVLNGGGAADTMIGGDNNDVYYIDALDTVTEGNGVNSGIDTIYARINVDLANHANVENLVLYGGGPTSGTGTAVNNVMNALSNTNGVTFTGLDGDDVLYGSQYADTLIGGNGKDIMFGFANLGGINTMTGGANDDAYYSARATDVINENLNEGFDIVFAIVNRTLSANTEYLYIYGLATSGTGNSLANTVNGFNSAQSLTLDGAEGNDVIYGSNQTDIITGGTQNDVMNGYGGTDTFRFAAAGTGADQIYGFDADPAGGQDLIDVSGRGFSAASIGTAIIVAASGANTLVTIGADTILLHAIAAANVTATDFVF